MREQIKTKFGVSRTRLENVVNVVQDILDMPLYNDIPELESKESAEKKKKSNRKRFKNFNTNQMLSRLPVSLAQLKEGNN